jgi:hypothetical protein
MKRRCIILYLLLFAVLNSSAQYGPVGFVNYNDGINGITGGSAGEVVRVTNRQDLASTSMPPSTTFQADAFLPPIHAQVSTSFVAKNLS